MNRLKLIIFLSLIFVFQAGAQEVSLFGYTFEENDRGFLNEVKITVLKLPEKIVVSETVSNINGEFKVQLTAGNTYLVRAQKDIFKNLELETNTAGKMAGDKVFLKMEMKRKPGYLFDATLAESRTDENQVVDAIQGALIEVYNNTSEESEMVLKDHSSPYFSHTFEQGNHYTIMIRKEGFLAKRIEAYINIKGCIICVDGVKKLGPGITDNLTAGFEMGTLLANIELNRADLNSKIAIDNIYYDLNKSDIRPEAAKELDKVVTLMIDNPEINVELGSHTDSRGGDQFNLDLSSKRAKAAVDYILSTEKIDSTRIIFKGYGESQLVNGCKNGVPCSEKSHQLNRRTELKIIGFNEKKTWRSLEEMIREEKFQRELEAFDNQEVIRITKDGRAVKESAPKYGVPVEPSKSKVPPQETEIIKVKKSADVEISKGGTIEADKKVESFAGSPEYVDPIIELAIDSVRKHAQTKEEKHEIPTKNIEKILMPPPVERPQNPVPAEPTVLEESAPQPPVLDEGKTILIAPPVRKEHDEIMKEAGKELEKINAAEEVEGRKNETSSDLPVLAKKKEAGIVNEKWSEEFIQPDEISISQEKINRDIVISAEANLTNKIPTGYTGYKVEVLRTKSTLPGDHFLFSEYKNIFIERLPSGEYAYLLGDFQVKRIALYYLNNTIINKFSTARLVLFDNGKRR